MDPEIIPTEQNYQYFANLVDELPPIHDDSITSRTLFSTERIKVILFGFASGQELSEHTASVPAIINILTGEADLTLGTDSMRAQAGTWAHMPAQLQHSVYANTELTMLLILLQD